MLQKLNEQPMVAKLGIAIVIAAALAATGWYAFPNVGAMREQNEQNAATLAKKLKENADLKQYETKSADLDRQIAQLQQQMELQKRIVPDEKEADKFIIMLQETASNAGINFRKLEAKSISTKEFYTEVPFAIEIDGPYYGVLNFFERLAGQTRIVNVDGIGMKGLGKGQKFQYAPNDSVEVAATAKTFYSREGGAPAPAAGTKK